MRMGAQIRRILFATVEAAVYLLITSGLVKDSSISSSISDIVARVASKKGGFLAYDAQRFVANCARPKLASQKI